MFHVKQFNKLREFAENNRIPFDEKMQEQFCCFCNFLLEENQKLNLTTIVEPSEVEIKHFIDSIYSYQTLKELSKQNVSRETFSLIDIGTGAGFPGIPLKIVFPEEEFVLADSLNKRINFLNSAIEKLDLKNIRAVAGRAEDLGKPGSEFRERFDFCVSRAVAAMPVLVEYSLPFVKKGGCAVLYKSGEFEEELKESQKAIEILGGELEAVKQFILPNTDAGRSLIIIRKKAAAPDKYPRRSGKPSKSPLK